MLHSRGCYILGTGGHSNAVFGLLHTLGVEVLGFVDQFTSVSSHQGLKVLSSHYLIPTEKSENLIVAVGDNYRRSLIVKQIKNESNQNFKFPSLIHPQSCVSPLAIISEGTVVMGGVNIGPFASVGRFSILNSNSSLDHDSKLGEFSSLAPGAITGGSVVIGSRVAISLGSIVSNAVEIGDDVVVGANSFVKTNLKPNILAYGNPAKVIRERNSDEVYL